METQTSHAEGQTAVVEQPIAENTQANTKDPNAELIAKLEATNRRLLEESKANKLKAQEYRQLIEKTETEALTKKEDYKQLLEKERQARIELEQKYKSVKLRNLDKTLDFELSKLAPDAYDINLVKQSLPRDQIDAIEEGEDFQIVGAKESIEKLRVEKPFLFKPKSIPSQASGKPVATTTGGQRSLSSMSPGELASLLAGKKL